LAAILAANLVANLNANRLHIRSLFKPYLAFIWEFSWKFLTATE